MRRDTTVRDTGLESAMIRSAPWILVLLAGCTLDSGPGEQGPKGPAGLDGTAGTQGTTGPTGPIGPTGATGADGVQGLKGDDGAQGPQGDAGVAPFSYVDDATMTDIYYDGGKVGIGTLPSSQLHVGNDLAIGSSAQWGRHVVMSAGTSPVSGRLDFAGDGTGWRFEIGQLGLANPFVAIRDNGAADFNGAAGKGARLNLYGDTGLLGHSATLYMYDMGATTAGQEVALVAAGLVGDLATGNLEIFTKSGASWISAMYAQNGKIGIGTTSPGARLHVDAGNDEGIAIHTASEAPWALRIKNDSYSGQPFQIVQYDDGHVRIDNAGNEEMIRLDQNGCVGIGTITTPMATLDVNGTARLKAYSGSEPFACDATRFGTIALNGSYDMCICKPVTGWVHADGGAPCTTPW